MVSGKKFKIKVQEKNKRGEGETVKDEKCNRRKLCQNRGKVT